VALSNIPTSSDPRVVARRIYRTIDGNIFTYYLLAEIGNNTATTLTDNTPDTTLALQPTMPTVNTASTGRITVTLPTSSDGRVTKRRLYRTSVNGTDYKVIATINDNGTTTYSDNIPDTSRGDAEPATSTAGSGQISVTSIPLGPAGTTARNLYRTEAGGSVFKFLRKIGDNSTTTFTDNIADSSLGENAPTVSTIGALAGNTSLRVKDLAAFPAGGWVRAGEQLIRFTGRSSSSGEGTLTGIPASGVGAIGAPIAANVSVVNHPHLTGVTGILYTIKAGDDVNVLVTRNNTSAQTALAAVEGGDGIHEHFIQDRRLSVESCEELADAELSLFSSAELSLTFKTRDTNVRSGKSIVIDLGAPTNISGTFKIQRVVLSQFGIPGVYPLRQVTASNYLFTIDHLLRRVSLGV
jgi:hypothetical protein